MSFLQMLQFTKTEKEGKEKAILSQIQLPQNIPKNKKTLGSMNKGGRFSSNWAVGMNL